MRLFLALALLMTSTFAGAQATLPDYRWTLTDITSRGLTKEFLFSQMDRDFVRVGKSICSNRAHMWANNFKRQYGLNTAKIFLFFTTEKNDDRRFRVWWYHVAPMVLENGQQFVMDPLFGGPNDRPLTKTEWFRQVTRYDNCKEIKAGENELIELMFSLKTFPKYTSYGKNDCYYRVVPHAYWIPQQVATNLLGVDENGRPTRMERFEIEQDELYQACIEATSSKIGYALGTTKKKCKEYVGL